MAISPNLRQNKLLDALPDVEFRRLARELEAVELHPGQALFESGDPISYAYFPTTALVSMVYEFEDGTLAESALVGNEGLVGIAVFMGGNSRLGRAVVLRTGTALRLRAQAMREEFERCGAFMHLLLRYTQALMTQTAQTAACNRHHTLEERLCRWLLLGLDRVRGDELVMTQELIANSLGVRREGVTEAAQRLHKLGLIHCSRGRIVVLDRGGLERRACECYAVVRNEYERLLPRTAATSGAAGSTGRPGVFDTARTDTAYPSTVVTG